MNIAFRFAAAGLAVAAAAPAASAQTRTDSGGTIVSGVYDTQSSPFQGATAMTTGTTYAAQRSVGVLATVAGNVEFQFPDASTITLPVYAGWQTFPFACAQIVSSGTTATATYYNLK
jgi:hypothetical protein